MTFFFMYYKMVFDLPAKIEIMCDKFVKFADFYSRLFYEINLPENSNIWQ